MAIVTENVKIETEQLNRVRKHVAAKKQTIGGYISLLIKSDMDKIDARESKKKSKQ